MYPHSRYLPPNKAVESEAVQLPLYISSEHRTASLRPKSQPYDLKRLLARSRGAFGGRHQQDRSCKAAGVEPVNTEQETEHVEGEEGNIWLLKEWKITIDALVAGQQICILRKGGIHERAFALPSSEFLFFPSFFHATPSMLKPEFVEQHSAALKIPPERPLGAVVEISAYARCTGLWSTKDPDILSNLKDLHIWSDEFLHKRLGWKMDRPLSILELRVTPLLWPIQLEYAQEHGGCKSWIPHHTGTFNGQMRTGAPALNDTEFAEAQRRLRERLKGVEGDWHTV
ncbi:hypothetical protein KFL_004280060 [Klebsormidium nitens]|uniref:DUF1802 family protein n=1 Tax=Klebsormidium nitens TaxID=105231 RepID=A0A1Y1II92_KLENI|nr:hypothetical protein KFL_004280060 [Klebsormidium nitens]|eukprot:GAQ88436.1 hypothetical protein KFL_004280060 [Klebsormidium nitens]